MKFLISDGGPKATKLLLEALNHGKERARDIVARHALASMLPDAQYRDAALELYQLPIEAFFEPVPFSESEFLEQISAGEVWTEVQEKSTEGQPYPQTDPDHINMQKRFKEFVAACKAKAAQIPEIPEDFFRMDMNARDRYEYCQDVLEEGLPILEHAQLLAAIHGKDKEAARVIIWNTMRTEHVRSASARERLKKADEVLKAMLIEWTDICPPYAVFSQARRDVQLNAKSIKDVEPTLESVSDDFVEMLMNAAVNQDIIDLNKRIEDTLAYRDLVSKIEVVMFADYTMQLARASDLQKLYESRRQNCLKFAAEADNASQAPKAT